MVADLLSTDLEAKIYIYIITVRELRTSGSNKSVPMCYQSTLQETVHARDTHMFFPFL
jgi:hypothetical protein